jgi:hypothetical protein
VNRIIENDFLAHIEPQIVKFGLCFIGNDVPNPTALFSRTELILWVKENLGSSKDACDSLFTVLSVSDTGYCD